MDDFNKGINIIIKAYAGSHAPFFDFIHKGNYSEKEVRFYFERFIGLAKDRLYWIVTDQGAVFWIKPHTKALSFQNKAKMFVDYLLSYGPGTCRRLIIMAKKFGDSKQVIGQNSWEGHCFGVLPLFQGKGVGKSLLEKSFQQLDSFQADYFLFTQYPQNVPLYEKFGFKVFAQKNFNKNIAYYMVRRNKT